MWWWNSMKQPPFISKQMAYWDQLDMLGVLHNGAYINFFERARTEFWRSLGVKGYNDPRFDWPYFVARNEIDYLAPITNEEPIEVSVFIVKIGTTSLTFGHELHRADGVMATRGATVLVRTDPVTQKPIPWSEAFREMVAPFVI